MNPEDICRRFSAAESARTTVEEMWTAIEAYITPYRGKFFRDNNSEGGIEWQKRRIFDSTAVMAHQSLASSLHGSLTNPMIRWFDVRFRDKELMDNGEASRWLDIAAKRTYDALQDSNFNLEINEIYRDLTGYGTSFLLAEPTNDLATQWEGLNFTSIPLKEGYFEQDDKGQVHVFFRHMQWTASRIVAKFGVENCPENIRSAEEKGSDERFSIIFTVYKRKDHTDNGTGVTPPNKRPWAYKYVLRNDKTQIGAEGGYYERPVYAPRWLTTSESVWGNSPAMVAMADVLTLNQLVELVLAAAEKAIDPTILAEERAMVTDLSLGAGEINIVKNIDRIRAHESHARFDVSQLRIEDLRAAINRYFFVDQLELKESPAMTATEVQVRYELMQRLLAATLARLQNDLLDPLIETVFKMLLRAGEFPDMPEALQEATHGDMDVEYVGALSRSQRMDSSAAIERWIQQVMTMAQSSEEIAAEVLAVPDWAAIVKLSARALDIPQEAITPQAEIDEQREVQEEQKARQAEAMTQQEEGAAQEAMQVDPAQQQQQAPQQPLQ